MLNAVLVIAGAVVAWLVIDRLLTIREERLRRGRAAWLEVGADRTFHSTGWEETVTPLEALEPIVVERRGSRAPDRAAA